MDRDAVDNWVLARVLASPGITARELAEALGDGRVRSQQRNTVYVALGRLRHRGLVESKREANYNRWYRIEVVEQPVDRSWVESALARLGQDVWPDAQPGQRHAIECAMVDLMRALGQVPLTPGDEPPLDLVHYEESGETAPASPEA